MRGLRQRPAGRDGSTLANLLHISGDDVDLEVGQATGTAHARTQSRQIPAV